MIFTNLKQLLMRLKRFFITTVLVVAFAATASAQGYRTAAGLFIDFGDGSTLVGPHIKHFFTNQYSGQAMVLFGSNLTTIGVEGAYNTSIPGAKGLVWNIGIGPQAFIGKHDSFFGIRPSTGLEFTLPSIPFNIGFDWRPMWLFWDGDYHFEAGRFSFAFRYTFR